VIDSSQEWFYQTRPLLARDILVDDTFVDNDVPYIRAENLYKDKSENNRTLYQWLPLILVFQALFFRIPD
jgi:hypothetical protein